ncbi:toxin co-regulated pilus biosynthesis Q family protein, partial [bacterium]|nr:toxin co-regulated pilus biosynthesis Q family protein [bacterium]
MKKFFLLSFYISCVCGFAACTSSSQSTSENLLATDEEPEIIDATVDARSRCGVNGISCNDTPLVNYAKTEADFREYGERTKKGHLYTQAGIGNNLTASVRPAVEEDIVTAPAPHLANSAPYISAPVPYSTAHTVSSDKHQTTEEPIIYNNDTPVVYGEDAPLPTQSASNDKLETKTEAEIEPSVSEGIFRKTIKKEIEKQPKDYKEEGKVSGEIKQANNLKKVETVQQTSELEIVCETNCEDILTEDADVITSEFTEDSFDIADYVSKDEEIAFETIGEPENAVEITEDIAINNIQISDSTVLTWEAEEGDNLRELLTKWSSMAGWKLLWQTNRNYILSAGVMFKGNFADVSSALVRAFARARPAPIATYYKGNRVIVVETME